MNLGAVLHRKDVQIGLTAALSASAGSAVTYFVVNKRLAAKYDRIAQEEIAEARRYFSLLHKKDEFEDPVTALEHFAGQSLEEAQEMADMVSELKYAVADGTLEVPVTEGMEERLEEVEDAKEIVEDAAEKVRNVFDGVRAEGVWDLEEQKLLRRNGVPYIISKDEYYENEGDYEQTTLTYFEGDNVLADATDTPVKEDNVGEDNLLKFGFGSEDGNIVYVRNEQMEVVFEIVRSMGTFAKEVLGFEGDTLEHSERRGKSRRPRNGDG